MTLTNEQKAIIDNERTVKYVRLEFPDTEIDDIEYDKIYQESMSREETLWDGDNLQFGKCNAALFKIRVADFTDDINGLDMDVYINFVNDNLGSVEIPYGKYKVQSVERTSDRRWRDITALDYMSVFDVDILDFYYNTLYINPLSTYTPKRLRELLCSYLGVICESVTLINDSIEVGIVNGLDSLSAREFLEMILEINGAFGQFDFDGTLRFIVLSKTNTETISGIKQQGCDYEDYDVVPYNSIVIQNQEGDEVCTYYPSAHQRENRYIIANNILLYNFNNEQLTPIATTLYNNIYNLSYRNNSLEVFSRIYLPMGQYYETTVNTYVGSEVIANTFQSFILKRTITGIQAIFSTISASGEQYSTNTRDINKEVASLRSKTEVIKREIEALENKVGIYLLYDNETAYSVSTNEKIIEINFKTNRKSYMVFHASVIFNLETDSEETTIMEFNDGKAEFQFIINGLPIPDYKPKVTYQDGTYTIHLDYTWYNSIVDETVDQNIIVTCTVSDCIVTIPTYRIHGYLTGDGLYIESGWDGRIYASDEFENLEFDDVILRIADGANVVTRNDRQFTYTENLNFMDIDVIPRLTDSVVNMLGMVFTTIVNVDMLSYTATISNNRFYAGDVITPKIHNINACTVIAQGDVTYAVSFDSGTTWKEYVNGSWIEGSTMTKAELEAVPSNAWVGDAQIKAVVADDGISNLAQIKTEGGTLV